MGSMKIKDFIYGEFEIIEPVLLELIKSKPVQRLKKISQYGVPTEYYLFPGFSRYDHSVGVMLLLRKLGSDLEEQVAGLLHDVSHTAFSHVVDWVSGDISKENFQDKNHSRIIKTSEIPKILKKYKLDTKKIVNLKNYPLLEKESPDLCADRIDYALREFKLWLNPKIVNLCINNLIVENHEIVFKSKKIAKIFAEKFLVLQRKHWGSADVVIRYYYLSYILKIAIGKKIIFMDDLYIDDDYVMKKIKQSNNSKIQGIISKLEKKNKFKSLRIGKNVKKKFRYVDPKFLEKGRLSRLSSEDTNFKKHLRNNKEFNKKGINVPLMH